MLIRNAGLVSGATIDLRIADGRVAAIAAQLSRLADEPVLDAEGGVLLPGLRDHHLHLQALAAARESIICGPPAVRSGEQLRQRLQQAAAHGDGWLRGIGYHESVAGEIDAAWLDRCVAERPLRIQHRSGRLWMFNSAALRALQIGNDERRFERVGALPDAPLSGRLYDADDWLRTRLPRQRPDLRRVSTYLASRGVVAVTDTTPDNGPEDVAHFAAAQARGELLQDLRVMGDARLHGVVGTARVARGEHKFHLHEHALPDFAALCTAIADSHAQQRATAFHCVTRTDLVFALAALREAGVMEGDRIEHAGVTPPELLAQIAALRLVVVSQPNFISERGEQYLDEVAADDRPWLYRLRGFVDAGVALAGSTDAPFGDADPWASMQAAVTRSTGDGRSLGLSEQLTPEQALALFTAPLAQPGAGPLQPAVDQAADLCLLTQPWSALRAQLGAAQVRACWRAGLAIHGPDARPNTGPMDGAAGGASRVSA